MPPRALIPTDEMAARLARVLEVSPADATDVAWIEMARTQETSDRRRRGAFERHERTILVRVRERGRMGLHRTGAAEPGDLENAVRQALAHARLSPPAPPPLPSPGGAPAEPAQAVGQPEGLFDDDLARLGPAAARELLQRAADRGDQSRLHWGEARLAVASTRGFVRTARATGAALEVQRGRGPGGQGSAAAAARSLAGLAVGETFERARRREAAEPLDPAPESAWALLLSQEATAALLDLLNRTAFSAASFRDGTSPLRGRLGTPVFHPLLGLRDDGTDPRGLPLPFDLAGAAARPVDLVAAGVPLTPALDEPLAAALGLPPTPHAVSFDDALATHLFLRPGDRSDEELASDLGDGALWVSALQPVECYDPSALRFRAVARGVRRLAGGALGPGLPDLIWEDGLIEVFARLLGVGAHPLTVAAGSAADPLLGGITAPVLAVGAPERLRPAPAP